MIFIEGNNSPRRLWSQATSWKGRRPTGVELVTGSVSDALMSSSRQGATGGLTCAGIREVAWWPSGDGWFGWFGPQNHRTGIFSSLASKPEARPMQPDWQSGWHMAPSRNFHRDEANS